MGVKTKTEHPHIERRAGVCGGSPAIAGTRFPVRSVVDYVYRLEMTPEEMVEEWNGLSLAQIHDALSYYHDHKEEIDRERLRNTLEHLQEHFNLRLEPNGRLSPKSTAS